LKVLEVSRSVEGYTVALVDDPKDGSAKIVVIHEGSPHAVALDLDSLTVLETLEISGARQSKRLADAVKEFLEGVSG
jgi:hypothetical protein